MRPSSALIAILFWPLRVVRANHVYILFVGCILVVWFTGWSRSLDHHVNYGRVVYPALTHPQITFDTYRPVIETAAVEP